MLRKSGAARALDSCHRPEGSWALGTRMQSAGKSAGRRGENLDSSNKFLKSNKNQSKKGDVILSIFYMALRVFTFQNALFILRLMVLITETFERQGILLILLTLYCA